jgi:hypothetical protein
MRQLNVWRQTRENSGIELDGIQSRPQDTVMDRNQQSISVQGLWQDDTSYRIVGREIGGFENSKGLTGGKVVISSSMYMVVDTILRTLGM